MIDKNSPYKLTQGDIEYFRLQNRVIRTEAGLDFLSPSEIMEFRRDRRVSHAYEFAHLSHGTHVAGIIARNNPNVEIMGIKKGNRTVNLHHYKKDIQSYYLTNVAKGDVEDLKQTVLYLRNNEIRVANGSFGTPYEAVINRFQMMHAYGHQLSEIKYMAKLYQKELLIQQKETLLLSPETLFVFAAGNSGYNNDKHIFTPANIDSHNSLTVAATIDRRALPSFSCYGANTVHVAAPGVGILSTVPGGHMMMTGTSQAAPYVSRVASLIIDENPNLTSYQVKEILMRTVDKKDFLIGKVISGGIVNEIRAVYAAKLSQDTSLDVAIKDSLINIEDM